MVFLELAFLGFQLLGGSGGPHGPQLPGVSGGVQGPPLHQGRSTWSSSWWFGRSTWSSATRRFGRSTISYMVVREVYKVLSYQAFQEVYQGLSYMVVREVYKLLSYLAFREVHVVHMVLSYLAFLKFHKVFSYLEGVSRLEVVVCRELAKFLELLKRLEVLKRMEVDRKVQASCGGVQLVARTSRLVLGLEMWAVPRLVEGSEIKPGLVGMLAAGIQQLQQAQLNMMNQKVGQPEQVKPGIAALPALDPPGAEDSPVVIQDWMELIDGPMRDLSDGSGAWWEAVKSEVSLHYAKWVASTPDQRLAMQGPSGMDLDDGRYARVNARAAGMLLAALAQEVRRDLVARQCTRSAVKIVYRLYVQYCPGGESEKLHLLKSLTETTKAADAEQAVRALRQWERWMQRAQGIAVTCPDPMILARGLSVIVAGVLQKNADAAFRTSLVKNTLMVDTSPTLATVMQYQQHLKAEMETLAGVMVMGSSRGAEPKAKPMQVEDGATDRDKDKDRDKGKGKDRERDKGKGKGKEAFGKGKDGEQKICPWFAKSSEGCRRGKTCRFKHSFEGISKRGRCLECGGEGHIAADCPTKALASRPSSSTGGKGGGGGHSQPSRAKEEPAARSMVSEPEPQPTSPMSTTTSASSPNPELQSAMTDAVQALRSLVGEGAGGGHPGLASIQRQLDELRLRALRVEDVVVRPRGGDPRMFKAELDVPMVLIDSGATNILRQPRDPHELHDANQVSVVLANNERTQLYQTPAGSILTPSTTTQPLLPMGDLVRAGCEISWGRKGLKIVHPTLGVLRTSVKAGCPELTMAEADKIIEQVENAKLQEFRDEVQTLQMKLEALKVGANTAPWTTHLDDYVASGSRNALWKALMGPVFGELPEALRTRLCLELNLAKGWDYLKALPLPRRVKKSFLQAPEWILHLRTRMAS